MALYSRKHESRKQREAQQNRYILIGVGVVAAVIALIFTMAAVDLLVIQPARAVAKVNTTTITVAQFEKAARFQRYQLLIRYSNLSQLASLSPDFAQYYQQQLQQIQTQLTDPNALGRSVVDSLIEDQLIRQEAARQGITVSAEEVEKTFRETFGYFPNGTETPTVTPTDMPTDVPPTLSATRVFALTAAPTLTPTATPTTTSTPIPTFTPGPTNTPRPTATPFTKEAFDQLVVSQTNDLKSTANLDVNDYRHEIESFLYRQKVSEAIGSGVPARQEQTLARHILVADETVALLLIQRLNTGEDWDSLAAQYSIDTSNKEDGGYLGWFPRGQMVTEFDTAAFSQTVGTISLTPVKTQFGYHIIQVLDRQQRPLDASALANARDKAFTDWLVAQRATLGAVEVYDDVWRNYVPDTPALPTG